MMNLMNVILMAPPAAGSNPNPVMQFLPLILIGIVFYFFMIRPQTKKMKDQKNFIEAIKKGDKVVTIGGVHGKIIEVQEKTFILEIADDIKVKIEKSAISADVCSPRAASLMASSRFLRHPSFSAACFSSMMAATSGLPSRSVIFAMPETIR